MSNINPLDSLIEQLRVLEDQVQKLKQAKAGCIKIGVNDFAYYHDHAYLIVENNGTFNTTDRYVGVRFAFQDGHKNQISWLELPDAEYFGKFHFSVSRLARHSPEDCDLSFLGL